MLGVGRIGCIQHKRDISYVRKWVLRIRIQRWSYSYRKAIIAALLYPFIKYRKFN